MSLLSKSLNTQKSVHNSQANLDVLQNTSEDFLKILEHKPLAKMQGWLVWVNNGFKFTTYAEFRFVHYLIIHSYDNTWENGKPFSDINIYSIISINEFTENEVKRLLKKLVKKQLISVDKHILKDYRIGLGLLYDKLIQLCSQSRVEILED